MSCVVVFSPNFSKGDDAAKTLLPAFGTTPESDGREQIFWLCRSTNSALNPAMAFDPLPPTYESVQRWLPIVVFWPSKLIFERSSYIVRGLFTSGGPLRSTGCRIARRAPWLTEAPAMFSRRIMICDDDCMKTITFLSCGC